MIQCHCEEHQQYNPAEITPERTTIYTSRCVITQSRSVLLYRVFLSSDLHVSAHLSCYTPIETLTSIMYLILFYLLIFFKTKYIFMTSKIKKLQTKINKYINISDSRTDVQTQSISLLFKGNIVNKKTNKLQSLSFHLFGHRMQ
jgi:hypothetical protein